MSRYDLEEAKKIIFNQTPTDRIIDSYETKEFWEFVCRAGGDVLTYRLYDDGMICER